MDFGGLWWFCHHYIRVSRKFWATTLTMKTTTIILIIYLFLTNISVGQTIDVFDTSLYAEKLSFCELTHRYVNMGKDFKYVLLDTSFYAITSYGQTTDISGNWTFAARQDSLIQIGFTSLNLPITSDWFNKLYSRADSLIKYFNIKHGKPFKTDLNQKNFFLEGKKYSSSNIVKAMWLIDGQKLKVEFIIDGEHNDFHYSLRISKFKDYYGSVKLPPWWDGY